MATQMTAPASGLEALQGKASLLIVDDDPLVVDFYAAALQIAGYQVSAALDGKEALVLYRQALEDGRAYDLVLLDANMPVMSGRDCLERLLHMDSRAQVLISSGTPESDLGSWATKALGVLGKPLRMADLKREIARSLRSNQGRHGETEGHCPRPLG